MGKDTSLVFAFKEFVPIMNDQVDRRQHYLEKIHETRS